MENPIQPKADVKPNVSFGVPESELLKPMQVGQLRSTIYNHAFDAVKALPPVQNSKYKLHLENPRWIDPETWSPAHQKKTFYQGGTLARRIAGDWVLSDVNTNAPLSRKTATITSVPHLNDRGLFLLNGSHWHLGAQTRLDPGIYPRRQENGDISAYVNPKGGRPHHISLDPSDGKFYFEIGSNRLPLMPIMKALGATQEQFQEAWGHDLVVNNSKDDKTAVSKLFKKLHEGSKPMPDSEERRMVAEKLGKWGFDPYVTGKTLGKEHGNYGVDSLLATTRKLLAISRKEEEPSERDHQAFQHILGQEHLFAERIRNSKPLLNQLLWKATGKGSLDNMPSGALNQHLLETITGTGLGVNAQMTNPAEMLDAVYRVSKMGQGGISCYSDDTEVYTVHGWKLWEEVTAEDRLACRIDGKLQFHNPFKLYQGHYEGKLLRIATKFVDLMVTPDHRHYVQSYGDKDWKPTWGFRTASDLHGKRIRLLTSTEPCEYGEDLTAFMVNPAPVLSNAANAIKEPVAYPFHAWVDFLAAYLADGSFSYSTDRHEYRVEVGKIETVNPEEATVIQQALSALGVTYRYDQNRRFIVQGKHLANYVSQFGKSKDKFVPNEVMTSTLPTRMRFLDLITTFDCSGKREGFRHYQSMSKRLRDQVADLAISCGFAVRYGQRQQSTGICFNLKIMSHGYVGVSKQKNNDQYQEIEYAGTVYCAEVPGNLLFVRRNGKCCWSGNSLDSVPDSARDIHGTQFGFIDPAVTPESGKIGVDLRFGSGTARSKDGRIYSKFHGQDGKPVWLSARDVQDKTIAAWEQRNNGQDTVETIKNGKFSLAPRSAVDLWTHPTENSFSPVANMIPFKSASPAHRTAMGTRMMTQALPLVGGEAPLVQTGHPEGGSFEEKYGSHFGAVRAQQGGRILGVTPDAIKVKYQDGSTGEIELHTHELYDHAPGRKTHFTQQALVKPGDFFTKDQLLAKSNYTNDKGQVALGLNASVGWLPARMGGSFEDAFAVSQSYADRMKSDHMSLHGVETPGAKFGLRNFKSLFPTKYDPSLLKDLDENGVIKPGTTVKPGQPLVLATRQMDAPRTTLVRSPKPIQQDASEIWDHDYPGQVVDVVQTKGGYRVSVKSAVPMQVGDKISGRHGNKGIITIVPDHEMPVGEDGKPLDVLVSPYTLSSRKNDSQIAEIVLGKIAKKYNKTYATKDFELPDLMAYVREEAKKHGVNPTETLTDPKTGTKIPGVLTGQQFFMKLHHVVESKVKQRDVGGYDAFDSPAKGGESGAKRMALADSFALIAHGANAFLQGSKNVRGQRNENWWEATMSGFTPPLPGHSTNYERLLNGMRAAGIHPVNENGKIRLKAMTDDHVNHFAGDRELQNPQGLDWSKEGDPVPGGLFDRKIFGEDHSLWGKIKLHKPMPNPAFEDPIRYTLGLTEKQMRNVIAGKSGYLGSKFVDLEEGQEAPRGFQTGSEAIHDKLKNLDHDKEIAKAHEEIAGTKKTKRDMAIRRLKYLQGAKDQGVHPSQWMLQNMPVLPPRFRPVSKLQGSNTELVSDPNYLYQDLFNANKHLKALEGRVADTSEERLALYDSMKAVSGLGDPINPKTQQKGAKGLLRLLLAESPKWSIPQNKLLSSPVDLVGRSTIAPDASLDMDEIGVPEDMAFKIYSRFAIQKLVKGGMSPVEATRSITEKSPEARKAVLEEMENRPVSYHRAPVLHKFGHIGAWPKLIKGDVIKLSPFVYKGLGGDNDGDTVNIHLPVYDKEIEDITQKMMPSKNLLSVKDFAPHYKPEREFHVGLWQASKPEEDTGKPVRTRVFEDIQALKAAFAKGEISTKDRVTLMKH